jgi:hypothetical protein
MNEPPKPRRFQFRLRTLLIGVTLFCIVTGGYIGGVIARINVSYIESARTSFGAAVVFEQYNSACGPRPEPSVGLLIVKRLIAVFLDS